MDTAFAGFYLKSDNGNSFVEKQGHNLKTE